MAFCSSVQIVHGATTLLAYGDHVDSLPTINGGQIVDIVPLLRATQTTQRPRGNESNTLEWTAFDKVSSAYTSARSLFTHAAALPRTAANVIISIDDGGVITYQLANAVVESWTSGMDNKREARGIRIVGGALTVITP